MADERIEVEWIATANKMMQTLDRMDTRFDKQEKQLQKLAQTSDKTANAAAGSFNKLEQELKENELALRKMEIGSKEFEEQRKKAFFRCSSNSFEPISIFRKASSFSFNSCSSLLNDPAAALAVLSEVCASFWSCFSCLSNRVSMRSSVCIILLAVAIHSTSMRSSAIASLSRQSERRQESVKYFVTAYPQVQIHSQFRRNSVIDFQKFQ